MLFNSFEFIIFLALFFLLWPYFRLSNNRRWIYLIVFSFFFYGWWDWRFLFLITGSGLIDFFAGLGIIKYPRFKKSILIVSILGNVGSLFIFKYLDFAISNINYIIHIFNTSYTINPLGLILPVGISFYTFQSMSYTIDIYRNNLKPTNNIFHFFAYLSMFPQLVAGPIVRAADLLPQLTSYNTINEKERWAAFRLIISGYFKKVVIADNIAIAINHAFALEQFPHSSVYWWLIIIMFSFQIYCDFSGYSDIACGIARWMGYRFPVNFNHPYISSSMREFWTRWHISLSSWFRDYVYIPLGGSKVIAPLVFVNLWITMLVSGLWHGAAWTFIVWSALHAFFLSIERITKWPERLASIPCGKLLSVCFINVIVLVAWVFFRSESISQAFEIVTRMFDFANPGFSEALSLVRQKDLLLIAIISLRQAYFLFDIDFSTKPLFKGQPVIEQMAVVVMLVLCVFFHGPSGEFIYFQF